MRFIDFVEEFSEVVKNTSSIWGLYDNSKEVFGIVIFKELSVISSNDLDAKETSLGLDDLCRWNEKVVVKEDLLALALVHVVAHVECFSSRTSLIEERGVADFEAGELLDHGLVVDEGLQTAL